MSDNSHLVYSTDGGRVPAERRRSGRNRRALPRTSRDPGDGVVRIWREKAGRRGKEVTVVRGLPGDAAALKTLASELKRLCGTGGFARDGVIELQGDQRERLLILLEARGFPVKLAGG